MNNLVHFSCVCVWHLCKLLLLVASGTRSQRATMTMIWTARIFEGSQRHFSAATMPSATLGWLRMTNPFEWKDLVRFIMAVLTSSAPTRLSRRFSAKAVNKLQGELEKCLLANWEDIHDSPDGSWCWRKLETEQWMLWICDSFSVCTWTIKRSRVHEWCHFFSLWYLIFIYSKFKYLRKFIRLTH